MIRLLFIGRDLEDLSNSSLGRADEEKKPIELVGGERIPVPARCESYAADLIAPDRGVYTSLDLPLYAEGGLEAVRLYASSKESVLSRTDRSFGEPMLLSRLALTVRGFTVSVDGRWVVSLSGGGDSSIRGDDNFRRKVRCSELDLDVTLENPEG